MNWTAAIRCGKSWALSFSELDYSELNFGALNTVTGSLTINSFSNRPNWARKYELVVVRFDCAQNAQQYDAPIMTTKLTLAEAPVNFRGPIQGLEGDSVLLARLRELGFVPGEVATVKGRAAFGEPILVSLRNMTVALRKQEAECILL